MPEAMEGRAFGNAAPARGGALGWALFGLRMQCRCVLSDPPAVADSCPAFAGQSCQRMGFPDVEGEGIPKAERQIQPEKYSLNALITGDMGSLSDFLEETPRTVPQVNPNSFFNALGPATCLWTVAPTAGKQAGFTSAVKRNARRTSSAGRTAYPVQTGRWGRRALSSASLLFLPLFPFLSPCHPALKN